MDGELPNHHQDEKWSKDNSANTVKGLGGGVTVKTMVNKKCKTRRPGKCEAANDHRKASRAEVPTKNLPDLRGWERD